MAGRALLLVAALALSAGCLGADVPSLPAGDWTREAPVPEEVVFPGSVSYETKYFLGPIELPTAFGLADRSTVHVEGVGLPEPGPGFAYAAWALDDMDYVRLGLLEDRGGSWILSRNHSPPIHIFTVAIAVEPVGVASTDWIVFQSPSGIHTAAPGAHELVAYQAYRDPAATLRVIEYDTDALAVVNAAGFDPGLCSDYTYREDKYACVKPPKGLRFCVWLSSTPAVEGTLESLGCRNVDFFPLDAQHVLEEAADEFRVVVSMHSTHETEIPHPSHLRPIDVVLCGRDRCAE